MKFPTALSALLLGSLAFPVSASFAQVARPFSANFTIDETLGEGTGPTCIMIGVISGQGNASHLGRTAISGTNCVTPPTPGSAPVFNFADGSIVLMAANGDTLNGTFSGSFVPTSTPNVFTVVNGTYSFSRGTGRFTAATGSGKLTGTQNIVSGKGQLQANGTLSY